MRWREFLGVLGGAAAWPLAAHALNQQTAKSINLDIPPMLLAQADEVIE